MCVVDAPQIGRSGSMVSGGLLRGFTEPHTCWLDRDNCLFCHEQYSLQQRGLSEQQLQASFDGQLEVNEFTLHDSEALHPPQATPSVLSLGEESAFQIAYR